MLQTFVTSNEIVNSNKQVQSNCNTIIFFNQGSSTCTIDQLILTPGMSWSIEGNSNELNQTYYNINFSGNYGNLLITRKILQNI